MSDLCNYAIVFAGVSLGVILTVDEAIKRNKKLTSANEKQEATVVSLKKVFGKKNNIWSYLT